MLAETIQELASPWWAARGCHRRQSGNGKSRIRNGRHQEGLGYRYQWALGAATLPEHLPAHAEPYEEGLNCPAASFEWPHRVAEIEGIDLQRRVQQAACGEGAQTSIEVPLGPPHAEHWARVKEEVRAYHFTYDEHQKQRRSPPKKNGQSEEVEWDRGGSSQWK